MRIDPRPSGLAPPPASPAARPVGGPAFRLDPARSGRANTATPATAAPARAAAPLATLDAILALQSEEDPRERRRRSAKAGQDLLDELDRLKAALLAGAVTHAGLARLADRVAGAGASTDDPALDAIVGAIGLRAQVELAKLARRPA